MKGWQFVAAAAAVLCGLLPPSAAEGALRPHAFSLSAMGGGYFFDSDQDLKTSSTLTLTLGYSFTERWMGEIVTGYIDTRSDEGERDEVDGFPLRFDLLYHFRPDQRFVPYFALGLGGLLLDNPGGDTKIDPVFGSGGGVRFFITESVALRADVRHLYLLDNMRFEGDGRNHFSAVAGLSFQLGGDVEPPPQVDSDGDGIVDFFDRCPNTPLGVPVDGYGCPADADHDGVHDYLDRCPGTPAGVRVNKDGCPQDSDRDGVPDYLDRCPATPGVKVDAWGCPLDDTDGDGVANSEDHCPETPSGTKVDSSGCPPATQAKPPRPTAPPAPPKKEEPLSLQMEFAPGRADIRPEFRDELARAAKFIQARPEGKIVVEGHTDSVGPAEVNLELSRRRAESVRNWLLKETGVPPERIRAVGLGESHPVGDNSTQEGRQRNRRVVISVEGG